MSSALSSSSSPDPANTFSGRDDSSTDAACLLFRWIQTQRGGQQEATRGAFIPTLSSHASQLHAWSFCPRALCYPLAVLRPPICTGHHWCQTGWGENQVQLNHWVVWLCYGRNYKTPQRIWVYCFLLIHYQIHFVHQQPFPARSAPSCQLANAVAQV